MNVLHFEPTAYASAEAFLADTTHPPFDCLVLDIQLGGMSGVELHQQLAASGSKTPVIFITAQEDPAVRAQVLTTRCAGFFHKTDAGADVLSAIRHAAGRHAGSDSEAN